LRRIFTKWVTVASSNEVLAMRLPRDAIPGVGQRYVSFPMELLVAALIKYSPVFQTEESPV
jgi:hypothetical protein